VVALGAQLLVEGGRDHPVAERAQRGPALAGVLERALDVLDRRRHLHRAGVVLLQVRAGVGGEVRQFAQRKVDLDDAAAALPVLDVAGEIGRQVLRADVLQERDARVQGGDHDLRADLVAVLQHHSGRLAVGDDYPRHPGVGADLRAEAARRGLDGGGHAAHAALLEAPVPQMPVADIADGVVGHHVRGAGLARAGPGADHAVDRERALHLRRFEPVVEQVGDAHGHQPGHVGDRAHVETLMPPGEPEGAGQVTPLARADRRGHGQQQRAEHLGQALQPGVPARHGVRVLLGPLGDLFVVTLGVIGVKLD
jgi:hypothetical protein